VGGRKNKVINYMGSCELHGEPRIGKDLKGHSRITYIEPKVLGLV